MTKIHPLYLSLISAILLYAAWPVSPFTFLIFIAFVPFLWMETQCRRRLTFFGYCYLTFLLWNIGDTLWICNASMVGGAIAIAANSLLMCLPMLGFFSIKRKYGSQVGYFSFIFFWMSFEYIHLNWQLSWPWLTIGNVFAVSPNWIQWYEFTGTSGGTLWVLVINILILILLKEWLKSRSLNKKYAKVLVLAILIPVATSYLLLKTAERKESVQLPATSNIVVVQPNIDPWDEKFAAGKAEAQLQHLIELSKSRIDSNTALVVWPETAVPVAINEDSVRSSYFMMSVWDFLKKNPSLDLLTGIEGFRFYNAQNKTIYSSKLEGSDLYADSYNSAALMDSHHFQIYHKTRMVPGAEVVPTFLLFLRPIFEKFGAAVGTYTGQAERTVLNTAPHAYRVAPVICYESIFGEFVAEYVRNGANVISIITNDGWWGNTSGYKQHENYARLRAIETRRWVVRSANTGISCFIDPTGKVIDPQPWDKPAAIKLYVPAVDYMTFFTKHGDLLSKLALFITMVIIVWSMILFIKQRLIRE